MSMEKSQLPGGSLQISTDVIGKIAKCAALEIEGVLDVSCGTQSKKLRDLLESVSLQAPVTVEMHDGIAAITLNLVVAFGTRVPAIAEKIQENVKSSVQNMTSVTVGSVDIVIAGLTVPKAPAACAPEAE